MTVLVGYTRFACVPGTSSSGSWVTVSSPIHTQVPTRSSSKTAELNPSWFESFYNQRNESRESRDIPAVDFSRVAGRLKDGLGIEW